MKLRTDLILRHLGNEYMVVEPGQDMVDMSKVYTLNDTAAYLWEQLQGKEFTVETVRQTLLGRFDVSSDVVQEDAAEIVSEFERQGLLV